METQKLDEVKGWFAGRVPEGWFTAAPKVTADDQQITVLGEVAAPEVPAGSPAELRAGAEAGRIARFREHTRGYRIAVAQEAEHRFGVPVTWATKCGGTELTFTPGGSGRRSGPSEGKEQPQQVMIGRRGRGRRFGGPRAWSRTGAFRGDWQNF